MSNEIEPKILCQGENHTCKQVAQFSAVFGREIMFLCHKCMKKSTNLKEVLSFKIKGFAKGDLPFRPKEQAISEPEKPVEVIPWLDELADLVAERLKDRQNKENK